MSLRGGTRFKNRGSPFSFSARSSWQNRRVGVFPLEHLGIGEFEDGTNIRPNTSIARRDQKGGRKPLRARVRDLLSISKNARLSR
jgi:hypothetical protein